MIPHMFNTEATPWETAIVEILNIEIIPPACAHPAGVNKLASPTTIAPQA